jgi:hypothetical protein
VAGRFLFFESLVFIGVWRFFDADEIFFTSPCNKPVTPVRHIHETHTEQHYTTQKHCTMKKLVLLFALLLGFTFTAAANNGNRDLMKRINNRLGFSATEKAQLGSGVAVVTFTIDGNGQINIQHCDATTEAQKQAVIDRLNKFYVHNAPVSTDAVYMIKIDFTQR